MCIRWVHNAMIFRPYHTSMVGNVYTVFPSGQSGQSGHGFEKPGSVWLKLSMAAKACGRPGNRRVERIGDPGKAARFPGKACRCPGKAARCPGKAARCPGKVARCPGKTCRSWVKPPDTLTTSAARVKLNTDWLSCSLMTF